LNEKTDYTTAGDKFTSGNGSVMRLSPVPIFFHDNLENAMNFSYKHSKTTHQGDEAAECCKLMAYIIVKAIHGDGTKSILNDLSDFNSELYSINCLKNSEVENRHESNKDLELKDRKWNWKDENFKYSPTRAKSQPGYIGSYAMDALAMSLHCIYFTNSFSEAVLKVANLRGDSDSVAAVTGQIAGAIYGVSSIDNKWLDILLRHEKFEGDLFLRAYKLFKKESIVIN